MEVFYNENTRVVYLGLLIILDVLLQMVIY